MISWKLSGVGGHRAVVLVAAALYESAGGVNRGPSTRPRAQARQKPAVAMT